VDKGGIDVVRRYEQLMSFAAMRLSRELGVDVRPALSRGDMKDPDWRLIVLLGMSFYPPDRHSRLHRLIVTGDLRVLCHSDLRQWQALAWGALD
jgi:hypothetical protein